MGENNRRMVVVAVMLGTFLAALDTSIIGTAMPTVVGQLGGLPLYSWVFSAYLLTSTTTVPLYGRLADLYGRKPVFLAAAGIFVAGSMLCGIAQSMPQLILFRAIQGLGAGGIIPVTLTIMGDIFDVEDRAKMQGVTSAVWGSSALAGPTVGGFIVDYIGWRWVFYINLPFGIASTVLLWLFLKEHVTRTRHRIDYAGTLSLTGSITILLLGFLRIGENHTWQDPAAGAAFGVAAALLGFFVWHEMRAPEPMLPLRLFRQRVISVAFVTGVLLGTTIFSITSYLPLFVQGVLGGTAITAGAVIAPLSLGWSTASIVSGRLILRFGYRIPTVAGLASIVLGALTLQTVPHGAELWRAIASAVMFGIGMGLSTTAFIIAAQSVVGWSERGIATAALQFSRTIGGAVGVVALGTLLSATMSTRLAGMRSDLQDTNALLDPAIRDTLTPETMTAIQAALADGLAKIYLGVLGIAIVAFAIVWLAFPRGRIEQIHAAAQAEGDHQHTPETVRRLSATDHVSTD